jgi:hypothetical protein
MGKGAKTRPYSLVLPHRVEFIRKPREKPCTTIDLRSGGYEERYDFSLFGFTGVGRVPGCGIGVFWPAVGLFGGPEA